MEGKRRDEEDMQYSLVLEEGMKLKFPYFATVQGSFKQEEVKQPHRRDTQRPMKTRISTCRGVLICWHTIWQPSGHVFVWKGCGKKFKTNNSINRQKKFFFVASLTTEKAFTTSPCGAKGKRGKGRFCPAPGRRQTLYTISIGNKLFGFNRS